MKIYSVKVTFEAQRDMENIYDGVLQFTQSPRIAMKQYDMIADGINSLGVFPERTPSIVLDAKEGVVLHRLVIGRYTVFYYVNDCEVVVTNVLYGSSSATAKLI